MYGDTATILLSILTRYRWVWSGKLSVLQISLSEQPSSLEHGNVKAPHAGSYWRESEIGSKLRKSSEKARKSLKLAQSSEKALKKLGKV